MNFKNKKNITPTMYAKMIEIRTPNTQKVTSFSNCHNV